MAASAQEFIELVGNDVRIDVPLLRRLAFYGIPSEVRGSIWKILLPTLASMPSKAEELKQLDLVSYSNATEYEEVVEETRTDTEIFQLLRLEVEKYCARNPYFGQEKKQQRMLNLVSQYTQRSQGSLAHAYHPGMVHVLGPFTHVLKDDGEALACYELMLQKMRSQSFRKGQRQNIGRFLMLLRSIVPQLYVHLEEEELEPTKWAVSWLQWLLCKELPFDCCLRLWDSYIAAPRGNGFELHMFVCLAILETCQNDLIELEQPELYAFLQHLPALDMDRIINKAQYLYRSVKF